MLLELNYLFIYFAYAISLAFVEGLCSILFKVPVNRVHKTIFISQSTLVPKFLIPVN